MKKIVIKIVGIELLLIFFYVANGAYVSIQQSSNPFWQFAILIPLAIALVLYITAKKKWRHYFFIPINIGNIFVYLPLIFVLCIILFGTKGLNFDSISDLLLMFFMQMFVVAFIEETVFRGILLRLLLSKGTFTAISLSSILFGVTHALQLIGGAIARRYRYTNYLCPSCRSRSIVTYYRWSIYYFDDYLLWFQ